jgi:hypothetical protein
VSRYSITHVTEIEAPIEFVWKALFDLDDWKHWNKWTLLSTRVPGITPSEGVSGMLKACYDGNDKNWQTFDFVFGEILHGDSDDDDDDNSRLLTWRGSVAGGYIFSGHHTMQLDRMSTTNTKLIHAEVFGGVLPIIGFGLPYKKLDRNYLLINESFKAYVEQKYKESQ